VLDLGFADKMFEEFSIYFLRNNMNVQAPLNNKFLSFTSFILIGASLV